MEFLSNQGRKLQKTVTPTLAIKAAKSQINHKNHSFSNSSKSCRYNETLTNLQKVPSSSQKKRHSWRLRKKIPCE